jgi:hypothetical protein
MRWRANAGTESQVKSQVESQGKTQVDTARPFTRFCSFTLGSIHFTHQKHHQSKKLKTTRSDVSAFAFALNLKICLC